MSAPYWKLRSKVQDAVVDYILSTDDPGIPVIKGFTDFGPITEPFLLVSASRMSPYIDSVVSQECGARTVLLSIEVRSQAEDVTDETGTVIGAYEFHNRLVARVMDSLENIDIVTALNNTQVEDFNVMQFDFQEENQFIEENSIRTTQSINVVCSPS